jgi:hypothetical protein
MALVGQNDWATLLNQSETLVEQVSAPRTLREERTRRNLHPAYGVPAYT